MADRIKPGDEVWDVQIPWAPKRCTVVRVVGDWAALTFAMTFTNGKAEWRTLLSNLEPVSAVDLLGGIADDRRSP